MKQLRGRARAQRRLHRADSSGPGGHGRLFRHSSYRERLPRPRPRGSFRRRIPTVSVPPQVMPDCSVSPVDDTAAAASTRSCTTSTTPGPSRGSVRSSCPATTPATRSRCSNSSSPTRSAATGVSPNSRARSLAEHGRADRCRRPARDPARLRRYLYYQAGSIFAQDYTPLGADYAWMYNDGYGGTNLDCTTPSDPGCWGHRDNILGPWATHDEPDRDDGGRQHRQRAVRRDLRQRAEPAGRQHEPHHRHELAAHAHQLRAARRRPGAPGLLAEHRGRDAGDHRGQLLRDDAAGVLRRRAGHQRPGGLGRPAHRRRARPTRLGPPPIRSW